MAGPPPTTTLDAVARRAFILRRLASESFLSVRSVTHELGVSEMTVRRDLRKLERDGAVRVVHGGASLPVGGDFPARGRIEPAAKAIIGRYAVGLIPAGAAVLLDAGTTVLEVARMLPADFDGYVFTHSVPVLGYLLDRPEISVHCFGGELSRSSEAVIGQTTIEGLRNVRAAIGFLGAATVSPRGVFVAKDHERGTKEAFIASSDRVVLLADHTKFSGTAPVLLSPLDVLDMIITDAPLSPEMQDACDLAEVEVRVAEGTQ